MGAVVIAETASGVGGFRSGSAPGRGVAGEPGPGGIRSKRNGGSSGSREAVEGVGDAPGTGPSGCDTDRATGARQSLHSETVAALRATGARFAMVHGSRAAGGTPRPDSDLDVAAWWPRDAPASFEVDLPPDVDLLVLNDAPLELAGRVALDGELLFDDDPPARVRWVATTRKIYADELPRITCAPGVPRHDEEPGWSMRSGWPASSEER